MIDLSQEALVALLLRSLLCGALLGVVYDGIRALKMFFGVGYGRNARYPDARAARAIAYTVTFITDLIFWLLVGVMSIALMYTVGGGVFRGMTYIAMLLGFVAYYFTLGRLMLKVSEMLTSAIKKLLRWLIRLILIPIKWLLGGIISLWHLTIGKFIGKIKMSVIRSRKSAENVKITESMASVESEIEVGKEDFVYVDGKKGYRKEGRISFGKR